MDVNDVEKVKKKPRTNGSKEYTNELVFLSGGGEMAQRIAEYDWMGSPIGIPPSHWCNELKIAMSICLASRFPLHLWWGEEHMILYNDAYIEILGPKHPAFMGKPGRECWVDIWDLIVDRINTVMTTGEATWDTDQFLPIENEQGQPDERYFTYSYSPIRVGNQVGGIMSTVQETTDRVIGEREMKTLRDMASRSTEATTTGDACRVIAEELAMNNSDFPFAYLYLVNDTHDKLDLVEVVGLANHNLAPSSVDITAEYVPANFLETTIIEVLTTRKSVMLDIRPLNLPTCGRFNKSPSYCMVLPISEPGHDKPPAGILVAGCNQLRLTRNPCKNFFELVANQVSTTIANAKAHERERERAEKLAEIDRAKTLFFSNISHEFRTPLTLILGPLEDVLNSKEVPLPYRESLKLVHRNSLRLLKLVNTLLDFSRIEAGRIQAQYEPTELDLLTEELASVFRSACEKEGIQLIVDCAPLSEPVYVDHDMWEKIVLNLLSNAFKFTLQGRIVVRIRQHSTGEAELEVSDTGCGMPQEELPKIFERFHRVIGNVGRTYEGSGIGLAFVQQLVKLHKGEISVESTVGEGSTFRVRIPLGYSHLPPESVSHIPLERSKDSRKSYSKTPDWWLPRVDSFVPSSPDSDSTPSPPGTQIQTYKIILVDDNADMREYVHRLLCSIYKCETAQDGVEALEIMQRDGPPDLLITDIMMPRMDGVTLLRTLRADPKLKTVPAIFLSARAGEEARVEGLQEGADDYLVKPFTAKELLARVKATIETSQIRLLHALQAQRANEAKDHFLAVLSHELRTPLTPALLLAEALQVEPDMPPKFLSDIQQIEKNLKLEVQLIDDLLDVTKIMKGKLSLNMQLVSVHELLAYTVRIVQHEVEEKGHLLITDLKAQIQYVFGDSSRLQQIFWNIIKNSIKFTPKGGKIQILTYNEYDKVVIRISDNGIGIDPAALPVIFNSFEQGERFITSTFGGLGLGLSISKALATMHNGELTAYSEGKGKGASFTLTLPMQQNPVSAEPTPQVHLDVVNKAANILLVEDNKPTLLIMTRFLNKLGYTVKSAMSVSEALEVAKQQQFDLVISDIGLPGGSGLDLMKELRSLYKLRGIALSGYGTDEDLQRSIGAGFKMHLTKPVELNALQSAIQHVLELPD